MLTKEEAVKQLTDAIQAQGKFNLGNVLDAVMGVAEANQTDLQEMLNELLKKQGVLTTQDEANLQALLAKKEEEKKQRQKIRKKNTLLIIGVMGTAAVFIYFVARKKPAKTS